VGATGNVVGAGADAPGTNTLVVEISLGEASGAGAEFAFGAAAVAGFAAGVVLVAGVLRVNHQIAAATAVSATPPKINGSLLLEEDDVLALSNVVARNDEGGAAAVSPFDAASPSFAKRASVDSTSGCGRPLIEESESIDIGVLNSANNLRCLTESAAPRTVVSSCASVVALHIVFAQSAVAFIPVSLHPKVELPVALTKVLLL
jgi:hypothetical protein